MHNKIGGETVASVDSSTDAVTLFASAAGGSISNRFIHNNSTAKLYLKYGAGASPTSYSVPIAADGFYEFPHPLWAGLVTGAWASVNGSAKVTEY